MTELEELQMKHREQAAEKRAEARARKARTHRLIKRGAMLEEAVREFSDPEELSDEELEQIVYFSIVDPRTGEYIEELKNGT